MKIFAGIALSAVMIASSSAATFTQTVNIASAPTDVTNAAATFLLFSSIGAPAGSILTGVTLSFTIIESLNTLTLTNGSTTNQTARYTASTNFDAGDSANAGDGALLDAALPNNGANAAATIYNTGLLSFTANQVYPSASFPLPKVLTEVTGSITGTTASYAGAGTFNLLYTTFSGFGVAGGGNQINNTQSTTTAATAVVVYTYTPGGVPEPASMALFGSGLLGLAILGRKKFARK